MSDFIEKRARKWCLSDLVTDYKTGRLRETLVWSNIGKGIASWGLVYEILNGTDSEWLWAIVMGILTAHELLSRYLNAKLPSLPTLPALPVKPV